MEGFGNWKIIFKYLFVYKKQIILLSVFGVISALANGLVPYLVGRFFDSILTPSKITINNYQISFWMLFLSTWLFVQLIASFLDWIIDIKRNKISLSLEAKYNAKGFGHILKLPMKFHKDNKAGEVFDKINRASQWLNTIVRQVVIRLAPQFLSVVIGLVISFLINWVFGLILILGVLIYTLLLRKTVPPAIKLQKKVYSFFGRIYGNAWEKISFPQAVKQSTAEDHETKVLHNKFVKIGTSLWNKIQIIWGKVGFYQRLIITLTQLLVFLISVRFIFNGTMTIGELIAINAYAALVFGPFVILGYNWQTIQNGLLALERSEKLLALPTEAYRPKNYKKIKNITGEIELKKSLFFL
ncbi:MAG: ABC transporter ATP-binding protein [Patescibacteria group bacterium]|nr:ABC transporter ATP-binding protein [Patescibacteria group bacterium]